MARLLEERRDALAEAQQARDDAIIEAYNAGGGLNEIARHVGMSQRGVSKLLERLGVRKPWLSIGDANRELERRDRLEREQRDHGE